MLRCARCCETVAVQCAGCSGEWWPSCVSVLEAVRCRLLLACLLADTLGVPLVVRAERLCAYGV